MAKRRCLDQGPGAGPWDFFIDGNYGDNPMRLTTGTYPTLHWDKKISSFMCLAPGPGA